MAGSWWVGRVDRAAPTIPIPLSFLLADDPDPKTDQTSRCD